MLLHIHLTETNLGLLVVIDIVVRGWLDSHHCVLVLGIVHSTRRQGRQGKVTVHLTAPAPVDEEFSILITMQHKGMTSLVIVTTVNDGTSQLNLLIECLFPLLIGKFLAVDNIGTFTEIEHGDECTGNIRSVGGRLIEVITHQHRLSAIAHEPSDVVIAHVKPVELSCRKVIEFYLGLLLIILVRRISHSLTHAVQRPLEEVHDLGHRRSHTTGERLLAIDLRTVLLVQSGLIPLGIHQRDQFRAFRGRAPRCVGGLAFQRLCHLGIEIHQPFHIVGSLRKVKVTLLGISQHFRHQVIAGNHHKTAVLLGIKHIISILRFRSMTASRLLRLQQLLTLQHLFGLLQGLFFGNLSCKHRQAAEEPHQ